MSFEETILPLRAELLRTARRLVGSGPEADDLVQDTLLRAYRGFATFSPGTNARAWAHRILRNAWINNHRAAQCRPTEVPTDDMTERVDTTSSYPAPELIVVVAQPDSDVHAAMAALSDDFRTVVYLADVEGYPCAAIAEMMGTPVGTVMSRLHRARRQLRMALGDTARRRRLVTAA